MKPKQRTVVYPGSFDPPTNGHIDLISRATKIFDKIIIAIITNPLKKPKFTVDERVKMFNAIIHKRKWQKNVCVDTFDGLLVDYLKSIKCKTVLRGLRAVSDFEYEFQMALTNRKIYNEIEIIYLMPDERWTYISSSLVKEIAEYHGDITPFVPQEIVDMVKSKYRLSK